MTPASQPAASSSAIARVAWLALAALLLLWAGASMTWPLGLDQGIFAWVGDTILRGGLPYRDAWEIKGPATHYLYALAELLSGREVWGVRVLDLAALALAALAAHRIARRIANATAGRIAAALLIGLYANGGYWHSAQPDGFAAFAWLGAAMLVARPDVTRARLVTAGSLCAFAALLKPPFGIFAALLLADRAARAGRDAAVRSAPALLGGLAAVLALACLGFAWAGALDDLVEVQLVFNPGLHPTAYRDLSTLAVLGVLARWFSQPWIALSALAFALGVATMWPRARADAALLLGWLALGLALVVVQNQFFHYHFVPVLAALAVGAGVGVASLFDAGAPRGRRRLGLALSTALLLCVGWVPLQQVQALARIAGSDETWERYLDRFGMGSFGFATTRRIADHVRAHTTEDDTILVWGFESGIYYLAGRSSSTRLGFLYPLIRGGGSELERRYIEEFRASLRDAPPRYVLRFAQALDPELPEDNLELLRDLEGVLAACYAVDPALAADKLVAWQRAEERASCARFWDALSSRAAAEARAS